MKKLREISAWKMRFFKGGDKMEKPKITDWIVAIATVVSAIATVLSLVLN